MTGDLSVDDFLRWVHQSPGKSDPPPGPWDVQDDKSCVGCRAPMADCFLSWLRGGPYCCGHCEHGMQVSQRGYSYASARAEGFGEDQACDLAVQPEDVVQPPQ